MKHSVRAVCALLAAGVAVHAQTAINLRTQSRAVDFSTADSTKPFKTATSFPPTCTVGEALLRTDAVPGQNLYTCTATNVWTLQGGVGFTPPLDVTLGGTGATGFTNRAIVVGAGTALSSGGCTIGSDAGLSCGGDITSGTASSNPGEAVLYDNRGMNFYSWLSPGVISNSVRYRFPAIPPAAGQVMSFGQPNGGISDITFVTPLASVFGRVGAVTAQAGDYTAAQITNAVDSSRTYSDPAWLTGLAWAKIIGAPAFGASGSNHAPGLVPDPGSTAGTSRYLREDGTWQAISGGGGSGFTTTGTSLLKGDGAGGVANAVKGGDFGLGTRTVVPLSATPTFICTDSVQTFELTLGATAVGNSTVAGCNAGAMVAFKICQDATGGRTFTPPVNNAGFGTIASAAGACSNQAFYFDGTDLVALAPMYTTGVAGGAITLPGATSGTNTIQAAAAAGTGSTTTLPAGNSTTVLPDAGATHNFLTGITSGGVISKAQPSYADLSGALPNPGPSSLGGVQSKNCTGTGHVLAINTDGTVSCSADSGGGGGSGFVSMGGECSAGAGTAGSYGLMGLGASMASGNCNTWNNAYARVVNHACTLKNLAFIAMTGTTTASDTVTIWTSTGPTVGQTATAVTCTTAAAGNSCLDTTHSAAIPAGSIVSVKVVLASGSTASNFAVQFDCQ